MLKILIIYCALALPNSALAKLCWNPVAGGLPVLDFEGKPTATLGGKVSAIKPCIKPRGIRVEDTPDKAACLNGALTVCDAKYGGMRLFINPQPNEIKPCKLWKVTPKPPLATGDYTYEINAYEGWRMKPDGTAYCVGD